MKHGISVWSFPGHYTLAEIFRTAKDAGFEGVEVALAEAGEINLNSTMEDMRKIKALAAESGIALYSVASGLYWSYPLTSDNAEIRAKAMSIVRKQLQIASWLACDTILVVPGLVGADFIPGSEVIPYDVAYERSLSAVRALKSDAEALGVAIGLENVWNKFLLSPLEMRDFIGKADSPYIGAYFDIGNVICNGYPEHWISILGKHIKKVHIKDFRQSVGNINGFVDLLAGDVNFPAVVKALDDIGYDGWVTAEMSPYQHCGDQIVYNTANAMRTIFQS